MGGLGEGLWGEARMERACGERLAGVLRTQREL